MNTTTSWRLPGDLPQSYEIIDDLLFITANENYHGFSQDGNFYPYGENCPPIDGVVGWMPFPDRADRP